MHRYSLADSIMPAYAKDFQSVVCATLLRMRPKALKRLPSLLHKGAGV